MVFIICSAHLVLSVGMVVKCYYNVAAIISIAFNFMVVFRTVCWYFGKTQFINDPLFNRLKSKEKTNEYRNICLDIATNAFIPALVSFFIGVIVFSVLNFLL